MSTADAEKKKHVYWKKQMFKRLVVWGGTSSLHSHRHIHRSFYENALKMGLSAYYLEDEPASQQVVIPGTTVIAANVWSKHIPYVEGVDYVLHNFDGSDPLCQQIAPERLLRLQVFTFDATGEAWDLCRVYNREARTLFQPWGTDLLPEEFKNPVYNPGSRNATFVGAVWEDMYQGSDLGNLDAIVELQVAAMEHGLNFQHLTQITTTDMIQSLREARLTPAIAGGWQVNHGYIPCRVLKNPTYGCLSFTNIPNWENVIGVQPAGEQITDLVGNALQLNEEEYKLMVLEQQEWVLPYNYRESILAIERALEEGR